MTSLHVGLWACLILAVILGVMQDHRENNP